MYNGQFTLIDGEPIMINHIFVFYNFDQILSTCALRVANYIIQANSLKTILLLIPCNFSYYVLIRITQECGDY